MNPFAPTPMTAEAIAGLIVDSLVDARLIHHADIAEAVAIACTEIEVRLALGNTIVLRAATEDEREP